MLDCWSRIEDIFKPMGKSWAWVASQINMKQQTLNRQIHKNTYPDINEAKNICTLFGISLEYLATGKEAEYPGISESSLKIALAADKLNEAGKKAALSMVEGLEKDFPLAPTSSADVG